MAYTVVFKFQDEWGRKTTRSWGNTSTTVADVLTDVATLGPLLDAVTQGALTGVSISTSSVATTFAASSPSNIDENASIKVRGGDGRDYDFDLPMPIAAIRQAGGTIDVADSNVVAFFAKFAVGDKWRVNLYNQTPIATVISGTLDK